MNKEKTLLPIPTEKLERQQQLLGDSKLNLQLVSSHKSNKDVPFLLCKEHSNQYICVKCDKFVKK